MGGISVSLDDEPERTITMRMPAFAYIRYSSANQNELTVETQRAVIEQAAARDDAEIVEWYIDRAESGRSDQRAAFQQMIAEVKRTPPPVTTIYVYNLSRFARDREQSVIYKALLRRHGVNLVSATEPIDTTTTEGRLLEAVIEAIDQFYSERLAEVTHRGQIQIARRGFSAGGRAPFGYRTEYVEELGKRRARLVPDPDQAEIIRRIFHEYADGRGYEAIARDLNLEGIPAPRSHWSKTTLHHLLRNEAYRGVRVWNRTRKLKDRRAQPRRPESEHVRTEGAHEAIVDEKLWRRARARYRTRSDNRSGGYAKRPLTGLLICARCGSRLRSDGSGTGSGDKRGYYRYYSCPKSGVGLCDHAGRWKEDDLLAPVVEALAETLSDWRTVEGLIREANQAAAQETEHLAQDLALARRQLAAAQAAQRRLAQAIAGGANLRAVVEELRATEERAEDLRVKIAELEKGQPRVVEIRVAEAKAALARWRKELKAADPPREIVQALIREIHLDPDGTMEIEMEIPAA